MAKQTKEDKLNELIIDYKKVISIQDLQIETLNAMVENRESMVKLLKEQDVLQKKQINSLGSVIISLFILITLGLVYSFFFK